MYIERQIHILPYTSLTYHGSCFYRIPESVNKWVSWTLFLLSCLIVPIILVFLFSYYIKFYFHPLEACLFSNQKQKENQGREEEERRGAEEGKT